MGVASCFSQAKYNLQQKLWHSLNARYFSVSPRCQKLTILARNGSFWIYECCPIWASVNYLHVSPRTRKLPHIFTGLTLFNPQNLHQVGIIMFALQLRKWRAMRSGLIHPGSHSQDMVDLFFELGEINQLLSAFLALFDSKSHHLSIVNTCPSFSINVIFHRREGDPNSP